MSQASGWGPPAEPKLRLPPTVKPHRPRLSEGQEAGCFHAACDSSLVHLRPQAKRWGTSWRADPSGPRGATPRLCRYTAIELVFSTGLSSAGGLGPSASPNLSFLTWKMGTILFCLTRLGAGLREPNRYSKSQAQGLAHTLKKAWFLPLEGPPRTTRNKVTTLWREAARGHLHNWWGNGTRPPALLVGGSGAQTPA